MTFPTTTIIVITFLLITTIGEVQSTLMVDVWPYSNMAIVVVDELSSNPAVLVVNAVVTATSKIADSTTKLHPMLSAKLLMVYIIVRTCNEDVSLLC